MNIVFCCDNNFVEHTCVSLVSLLETNKGVDIYIISNTLSEENLEKFKKIKNYFSANINIINIDKIEKFKDIFSGLKTTKEWSYSMYYRYLIPSIIKDSRSIYLDSDIIVKKNLLPLWNINLEGKLAGVVEHPLQYEIQHGIVNQDIFDIYFNSGVMLIDNDGWRRENILEKVLKITKSFPDKFPDQDSLNRALNGKCLKISKLFNLMSSSLHGDYFYDEAFIIHYIQYPKPWTDPRKKFNLGYSDYVNKLNFILK